MTACNRHAWLVLRFVDVPEIVMRFASGSISELSTLERYGDIVRCLDRSQGRSGVRHQNAQIQERVNRLRARIIFGRQALEKMAVSRTTSGTAFY